MSSMIDDEQLKQFQIQSDQAFLEMQTQADRSMQAFVEAYSEQPVLVSFRTPGFSWGQYGDVVAVPAATLAESAASSAPAASADASGPQIQQGYESSWGSATPPALSPVINNVAQFTAQAMEDAHQKIVNQARSSTQPAFDVSEMGKNLKQQAAAHALDLKKGAQDVLKQTTSDLGERAKREASAMREAAQRVMREETSIRGMAQRAKSEFKAAKDRIAAELIEAGRGAIGGLQDVATGEIKEIGNEFGSAIDSAASGNIHARPGLTAKAEVSGGSKMKRQVPDSQNPVFRKENYSGVFEHDSVNHQH